MASQQRGKSTYNLIKLVQLFQGGIMEINVSQEKGTLPVSVIQLKGDLDASSYLALVDTAQKLYNAGVRHLLLDLSDLDFISSAGLASLHIIIKMFRGERADPEDGWGTYREFGRKRESDVQKNVKLLKPPTEVDQVLETVGFKKFFEVYKDLDEAVQSFE
jgi:anti-anti-sigma factor